MIISGTTEHPQLSLNLRSRVPVSSQVAARSPHSPTGRLVKRLLDNLSSTESRSSEAFGRTSVVSERSKGLNGRLGDAFFDVDLRNINNVSCDRQNQRSQDAPPS